MAADTPEPPISVPSRDDHWGWFLRLFRQVVWVPQDLRKTQSEVTRLQQDLAGHMGASYDDFDAIRESIRDNREAISRLEDRVTKEAVKPITDLRLVLAEAKGGWRVMIVLGSLLGSIVGGIVVGLITGK